MPIVNGHQAETGCYVEGHWGQYGPDHLADQAEAFGWSPKAPDDDPRVIRRFQDLLIDAGHDDPELLCTLSEWRHEAADEIEQWLNDRTPTDQYVGKKLREPGPGMDDVYASYVWHWHDGEFFLSPICENGDCDDDTCAHHD